MLTHLQIRNFALIDTLELEFGPGMTVLTGETGAGKSILLDALGLTLGDRADSAAVRAGSERAEITVTFLAQAVPDAAHWLAEHELEGEEECILRRTVGADGRSRAYINGQAVPIQSLRELGELLVDIHGQHAHQSLLKREAQRLLLDDFAGHAALLGEVGTAWSRWRALQEEFGRLRHAAEERETRLDLLRYQVGELESLGLAAGESAELEEEHRRLANASRLTEGAQLALTLVYEDDEGSATSLLSRARREIEELAQYDPRLAATGGLLENAGIHLQEAAAELRHYLADVEVDPQRLAWLDERISAIETLARKHRLPAESLPARLHELKDELASLEQAGARLGDLEKEIAKAQGLYQEAAHQLGRSRAKAAERLSREVVAHMQELGMKDGTFSVGLEPLAPEEAGPHGLERVEFLVSANPGHPERPLSKVASGGELSRISLAIQVIAAGHGRIPTLVFDEVDVGVGGGTAERVGRHLRLLASERQVLCVTHQPQVAALGHHHLRITKAVAKGNTRTEVNPVADDQRVEELARMLGGIEITDQTYSHAREMMERAEG